MDASTILTLRLANQQLITTDITTPRELVSWMGAMQAQAFDMAKWGIGARLPGITDKQVEDALDRGEFVRTHILRPTWHFVSRDDIHWMLDLSAPRLLAASRSADKILGLTETFTQNTNKIIGKVLEKEPHLTRQEIGAKLKDAGVTIDNRCLTYIMYKAELNGVVCNGIVRGKKQTYNLLEAVVPKPAARFDADESLAKLASKYFRSHGPATLPDFVWWSGLTLTQAKRAVEIIRPDFIFEEVGSHVYIFDRATAGYIHNVDVVHLLPAFDELFVSYKDRKEIVPAEYQKKVIVSNGVFKPTIFRNGEIIGIWTKTQGENKFEIACFSESDKFTSKLIAAALTGIKNFYL